MARTLNDIATNIKTTYVNLRASYGLPFDDPALWSVVNIKRLMVYVVAASILLLEQLWDIFKTEVNQIIADDKPHRLSWYRTMALQFQLGSQLVTDEYYYDNTGLTQDQINAQLIIANAAAIDTSNSILIKLVKSNGTDYIQLDADTELPPATAYLKEIADAGIAIETLSVNPDHIQATIEVQYDPMILRADGNRLDGTSATPIQDAFKSYLFNAQFNSRYFKSKHVDTIQAVPGVIDVAFRTVLMIVDGSTNSVSVDLQYDSLAGFIRLYNDVDLILTLIPYQP